MTEQEAYEINYLRSSYQSQRQEYLEEIHLLQTAAHEAILAGSQAMPYLVEIERYKQLIQELEEKEAELDDYEEQLLHGRRGKRAKLNDKDSFFQGKQTKYQAQPHTGLGSAVAALFGFMIASGVLSGLWLAQNPQAHNPISQFLQQQFGPKFKIKDKTKN